MIEGREEDSRVGSSSNASVDTPIRHGQLRLVELVLPICVGLLDYTSYYCLLVGVKILGQTIIQMGLLLLEI